MTQYQSHRLRMQVAACLLACLIAATLMLPGQAFAEVRRADIIAGKSVEERGLTVAQCPSIDATYAALMTSDGTVLFERDANAPSQIASITKVMTAIVAIDNAPDGLFVAVSEAAAEVGESSAGLQEGDVMDLQSALKALLVPSGNDAAIALGESVGAAMIAADPNLGNDPMAAFVQAMNDKAAQIGCTDTIYENPHGLDDGVFEGRLHSTAADQAKVAQCAMQYPLIREIVGGGTTTIAVDRDGGKAEIVLETTDELLESYDYTIGIKTGVTNAAGPSFMGAANKDGQEVYSVVLGSSDELQRFQDTKNLFEWAFDHSISLPLASSAQTCTMNLNGQSTQVPVVAAVSHADWIDRTVNATIKDPTAAIQVFDFEGNVSQSFTFEELHGHVSAGDKVGSVVYKQRNQVVAEQDLVACEDFDAPNPLEGVSIWWQRLVGGFGGEPSAAESQVYNVMPIINNNKTNAA